MSSYSRQGNGPRDDERKYGGYYGGSGASRKPVESSSGFHSGRKITGSGYSTGPARRGYESPEDWKDTGSSQNSVRCVARSSNLGRPTLE